MSQPYTHPYIVAWHRLSGSHEPYIAALCERAQRENAPREAIYRSHEGEWRTIGDVTNEPYRKRVSALAADLG